MCPSLHLPPQAPGARAHSGRGGALELRLTWHFPVNLLEHSPVPVPGAVNTLGLEEAKSGHRHPNTKPQFSLLSPFSGHPRNPRGQAEPFLWAPSKPPQASCGGVFNDKNFVEHVIYD